MIEDDNPPEHSTPEMKTIPKYKGKGKSKKRHKTLTLKYHVDIDHLRVFALRDTVEKNVSIQFPTRSDGRLSKRVAT